MSDTNRQLGNNDRTRSYKGVVIGGNKTINQTVVTKAGRFKAKRNKRGRGSSTTQSPLGLFEKKKGTEMAQEPNSVKKVRKPLFQEGSDGLMVPTEEIVNAETIVESADMQIPFSDAMEDGVALDLEVQPQIDLDDGIEEALPEANDESSAEAALDELALEEVMYSCREMTESEQTQVHEELAAKLQKCKEKALHKPPLSSVKQGIRSTTPLRGR